MGADLLMPMVSAFPRWKLHYPPGYLSQSSREQHHGGELPKLSMIPECCEERCKTLATSLRKKTWMNIYCLYCQKHKPLLVAQKIGHQPSNVNHCPRRCVINNSGEQDTETDHAAMWKSSSPDTQLDLPKFMRALLAGSEKRNRRNIMGKSFWPEAARSSCGAVWTLMLPCSSQDRLRPKTKQAFVRRLGSGYMNNKKFESNTLADLHSFSCHRHNQSNRSFISSHIPSLPPSADTGSGRISVPIGALSLLLPILPWQSFPFQHETSYKADNIFLPNAEISCK